MVSCQALYSISSKLALALGESNVPFSGMNMIFAGDFVQLPPVNATSLFSGNHEPDPFHRSRQRLTDQKAAIGKLIWHQVTTVVILKQNMRQKTDSPEDIKFRTALSNIRTIRSGKDGPHFEDDALHNVSIITAVNSHKDKINEIGSARYARETGQELEVFYSEDSLGSNNDGNSWRPQGAKKRPEMLWHAHPSTTSYNIAGKLGICVGLPVMIRHNEATELCITKGQEGKIVGWQSDFGLRKQPVLDTLFVELIDPPKPIRIPGLPPNVVVLTSRKEKLWCNLPDDSTIQVTRSQIPVLPNITMTYYSSQGKTRPINVVDLNNCRTHFSYYTALSRGTSSAGTIIRQGADYSKITKGINGYLHQEFRELEILNEITRLRYEE
ncbi:hypothetical protein C8R45DRAFT_1053351 [Mycena sanguinolenta]|nr:hypothetical protein C8R45DRAFT_1053351 [Mycena sanguinolenta]